MENVELLAPSKDLETGIAAINSGADAVYIGASQFGARESASNPLTDIESLIRYAHLYWARVYVTVNTLLFDEEIPGAVKLIHQLYQMGADAIIIQDVGLLECDLPPIPLFASTQMHNNTLQRIQFLEKVGFQRVILARELSLEEIKTIRAQTSLELETFIHGALCVSYSGQCYASYALGGRSGNRGQCAQPCRRKYSLIDEQGHILQKDRYLLSLKDLNLSGQLDRLLEAGVRSFKIEGRLKDKNYVTNIVSHYRRQLDNIYVEGRYHAASSGGSRFSFTPNPLKTFNRSYTSYFLQQRDPQMGSLDTPKSLGEPIGKVTSVSQRSFIIDSPIPLHNGDGLCFFDRQRQLCGTVINETNGQNMTPEKMDGIYSGVMIYRNHDHSFSADLAKNPPERKIRLSFKCLTQSEQLVLNAMDEDGNTAIETVSGKWPLAEKPDQNQAILQKQLGKLGGTPFTCDQMDMDLAVPYFIPLSVINNLRRRVIDQLIQNRIKNHLRPQRPIIPNNAPFPENQLGFSGNVLNQKALAFYQRHGVTHISPGAETGISLRGEKVMTTRYCIKFQLGACPRQKIPTEIKGALSLVDEEGNLFPLNFDCTHCQMEVYFATKPDLL